MWASHHSPFPCLCYVFFRQGCAGYLPALLSHEKSWHQRTALCIPNDSALLLSLIIPNHCSGYEFWRTNPNLFSHCFRPHLHSSERAFRPAFTIVHIMQMIADSLRCEQDYSRVIRSGESKTSFLQQPGNFSVFPHGFWIVHYYAVIYLAKNWEGSIITLIQDYIIGNGDNSSVTNHLQSQTST